MKKKTTLYIVQGAVIAALYAALTIGQNLLLPGSASMAVQFRVAEVLTILAFYTPAAVPGLTLGCVIANISSVMGGLGLYDMVFGSTATLIAVLLMYLTRNVRLFNLPLLGMLMPALINGIIVGLEISVFFDMGGFTFMGFLIAGGCVALGELAVLYILGTPLVLTMEKSQLHKKLFNY